MSLSLDAGTYNLVCCTRTADGNFKYNREVNAFLEVELNDPFVFNMMKTAGVPLIERDKVAYALGEAAVKMAYVMAQLDLKRPMKDGCVNPREHEAFEILSIMIHSLIEDAVTADNETLYYSVPANAINEETDAVYHGKLLQSIFDAYKSEAGFKVNARPINEALALIYAELADKNYTGLSASFGSGMVNVCYAMFGVPVFQFALVNSGDWIDEMAARATGESATFINQEKTTVDLLVPPPNLVHRAVQTQYRIMMEKTVAGIKKGLANAGKKARSDAPIDMVIAGGTSLPNGFDTLFADILKTAGLDLKLGRVFRPADALYSVARGALACAENSK